MPCTLTDPVVGARSSRVLLIDDDPNLAEIVSALLAAFGYDFEGADGQSGLARFDSGAWDLVLVDLGTPEASAWELVQAIRQRAPTIPVVLLTGLTDSALLSRARECRVRVIAKPFRLETLKATLVEALMPRLANARHWPTPTRWSCPSRTGPSRTDRLRRSRESTATFRSVVGPSAFRQARRPPPE